MKHLKLFYLNKRAEDTQAGSISKASEPSPVNTSAPAAPWPKRTLTVPQQQPVRTTDGSPLPDYIKGTALAPNKSRENVANKPFTQPQATQQPQQQVQKPNKQYGIGDFVAIGSQLQGGDTSGIEEMAGDFGDHVQNEFLNPLLEQSKQIPWVGEQIKKYENYQKIKPYMGDDDHFDFSKTKEYSQANPGLLRKELLKNTSDPALLEHAKNDPNIQQEAYNQSAFKPVQGILDSLTPTKYNNPITYSPYGLMMNGVNWAASKYMTPQRAAQGITPQDLNTKINSMSDDDLADYVQKAPQPLQYKFEDSVKKGMGF